MRHWVLLGVALVAVLGAALAPRIGQDPAYHQFADRRGLWGIPNFWNVVSNLPYFAVGLYGLRAWRGATWERHHDRWAWLVVALAGLLIGLGSGYYHWDPSNTTLFWDRLPMTLGFMGIFSAVIAERVSARLGALLLGPFLVWGLVSVEVWRQTEAAGAGDLRMYALVQFYPMLAIPLALWLYRSRYTESHRIWQMIAWYIGAKILEGLDRDVFRISGGLMSGHTLKHVAGAIALWAPLRMVAERRPADHTSNREDGSLAPHRPAGQPESGRK